tara:strand:+ start:2943 stop:3425 length:483 start_codon:yes stop_codon:yes gene_type:complete
VIDDTYYVRPEGVPEAEAAGGVVTRMEGGTILIAAAHEKDLHDPVLPKGHVDPGEDIETAARREIAEEVGVQDLVLLDKLDALERLNFARTEWKITHYYLYLTREAEVVPLESDVHASMSWVPLEPTPAFFWPEQRRLVEDHRDRIVALVENATRSASHV